MAPYIYDASHYAAYNSIMATHRLKKKVLDYWPKTKATDKVTGVEHDVFGRLYLLYNDVYLNLTEAENGMYAYTFLVNGHGWEE